MGFNLGGAISGAMRSVSSSFSSASRNVSSSFSNASRNVSSSLSSASRNVSSSFSNASRNVSSSFSNASRNVSSSFSNASRNVSSSFSNASRNVSSSFSSFSSRVSSTVSSASRSLSNSFSSTSRSVGSSFSSFSSRVNNSLSSTSRSLSSSFSSTSSRVNSSFSNTARSFSSSFSSTSSRVNSSFSNTARSFSSSLSSLPSRANSSYSNTSRSFSNSLSSLSSRTSNLFSPTTLRNTATAFGNTLWNGARQTSQRYNNFITSSYQDAKTLQRSSNPFMRAVGNYSVGVRDGVSNFNRTVNNSVQYWKGVRGPVGRVGETLAGLGKAFTSPLRAVDHRATNAQRNGALVETGVTLAVGGLGKLAAPVFKGLARTPVGQAAQWLNNAPARALGRSRLGTSVLSREAQTRATLNKLPGRVNLGQAGRQLSNVAQSARRYLPQQSTAASSNAAQSSLWRNLPPGVQVRKVGNYWVKRVDPQANPMVRWWGQQTINAQHRGLQQLGDMATKSKMSRGVLFTRDVGPTMKGVTPTFLKQYAKGSLRMKTLLNDIRPRNMGANGVIFDPALDPFTKALLVGGTAGSIGTGAYIGNRVVNGR